ncbi:MAG: hypothetical protein ACRDNS_14555, partial [Trebonia sp.]
MDSHAERKIAVALEQLAAAREAGDRHGMRVQETEVARWTRVKRDVDAAPPLSGEVRDRLAVLLRPEPDTSAVPAPRQRAVPLRSAPAEQPQEHTPRR